MMTRNFSTRALSVLVGGIAVLLLFPACFAALLSPMIFDAPGSGESPYTLALYYGLLATPIFLLIAVALAVLGFSNCDRRRVYQAMFATVGPLLYCGGMFKLIEVICGGEFSCH